MIQNFTLVFYVPSTLSVCRHVCFIACIAFQIHMHFLVFIHFYPSNYFQNSNDIHRFYQLLLIIFLQKHCTIAIIVVLKYNLAPFHVCSCFLFSCLSFEQFMKCAISRVSLFEFLKLSGRSSGISSAPATGRAAARRRPISPPTFTPTPDTQPSDPLDCIVITPSD